MHFGSHSGSKYVGMWKDDLKEGPGILSSGNGVVMACNPLFENDKPVHRQRVIPKKALRNTTEDTGMGHLFRSIVHIINKKVISIV